MTTLTRSFSCLALALLFGSSCGGGGGGGGAASRFRIIEASNGFGKLLPHQVAVRDDLGQPTSQVVEVTSIEPLLANLTRNNPVKPPPRWPTTAILPNGKSGNHFLFVRFSQVVDVPSVLSSAASQGYGALGLGIEVESVNSATGEVRPILGRAFVGGQTYGPTLTADPDVLELVTWVTPGSGSGSGDLLPAIPEAVGFPGTEDAFPGAEILVEPETVVFVVDTDGDLATHERFPLGVQIQMRITESARSVRGRFVEGVGLASSTVGDDTIPPEVLVQFPGQDLMITPGNADTDVDPQTNIEVRFTEPVQVLWLGDLEDGTPPSNSASIQLRFGPSAGKVDVPFHVRLPSVFDLSRVELVPVYDFPGSGPSVQGADCGVFGSVDVNVNPLQFPDLALVPNLNSIARSTFFVTREGPGIVNAPVTPDAIYVGRTGSNQSISVIDLNGFGAGTGDPTYDLNKPIKRGNSNYPNNPNVALQGASLIPPLTPGTCTFNGGSEGVFTLTKDSSLRDLLASSPLIESVGDMALGHALDNSFNNEFPFGCQAGGGNICAQSGKKFISLISGGPNTVASVNVSTVAPLKSDSGVENLVSWAPHPNPPPLSYPPLCLSPLINGVEPTSIVSFLGGFTNLLGPGPFPQGIPDQDIPPQGTLVSEQNSFFEGPSNPQPTIAACPQYMMRQQVGQFLYLVDRVASEIVVFNSNRFTVLDRIRLPDPTSLAMSPNLDFLAVTNEDADQVSFIDIDPSSATFHQVVRTTRVGAGPTGIAWEPGNEDIFVCNQDAGTVSILSAFTLDVRKTLRNQVASPIDVAITPRQGLYGFARGVYFAYILNQNGRVAFFESGPDGVNGIGFDDVIGSLPFRFARPKTLQADPSNLNSAVWIAHEEPLNEVGQPTGQGGGAMSNVGIAGGTIGIIPLDSGLFLNPQLRQLEFGVHASFGEGPGGLSGIPSDLAFDNMRNVSALTNFATQYSAGNPLSYNGKALVKAFGIGVPASTPQFMFAAVPNPGVVDVFDMTSASVERIDTDVFLDGVQSITAPNASILMDYFRQ